MVFHNQADHLRRITNNGIEVYIPCLALDKCPDNCGHKKNDVPDDKSVKYGALSFSDMKTARQAMGSPTPTYQYMAELNEFLPSSNKMPPPPPGPPQTLCQVVTGRLFDAFF